jgi:hypothetical protein
VADPVVDPDLRAVGVPGAANLVGQVLVCARLPRQNRTAMVNDDAPATEMIGSPRL